MPQPFRHRPEPLTTELHQLTAHPEAAVEPVAEPAGRPGVRTDAAAEPEMNRRERVIFTVYAVLAVLTVLFLAATAAVWWLGA
jgi:hypothetical protein